MGGEGEERVATATYRGKGNGDDSWRGERREVHGQGLYSMKGRVVACIATRSGTRVKQRVQLWPRVNQQTPGTVAVGGSG
ncbi:hypothetical protein V6N11_021814 [Hibiscus sabdariffa]|uniref:Uncharacterized protein n=1 Tax=Hibiscus sabdariffa TaxID=183260 RepID=A0ABR2THW8_9ROSI